MNNSTLLYAIQDFHKDLDYFAGTYENQPFKIVAVALSIVGSLILLPFLLGIVWNERHGSDEKKVIINNIIALLAWSLFVYISVVQPLEILRNLYGPLPVCFCFWFHVLKNTLTQQLSLLLDAVIIIRYLFIFKLKNPGTFQDGFWTVFISIWTFLFCLISQWLLLYLPGNKPLTIWFCSGSDLSNKQPLPTKNMLIRVVLICSFTLLLLMLIRIEKFRRKDHIPVTWWGNQKVFFLSAIEDKLMSSYLIYLMVIVNMVIGNALVIKINSLPPYKANFYPNNLYVITFQLISPIEIAGSMVMVYYLQHRRLTATLIKEFKELFGMQNN